jgi:hypothetical protein
MRSKFLDVYANSTLKEEDQLCEYYLYNYVFPDETKWNPLMFVGDLQVRALASYYKNEKFRGEIMEEYEEREKCVALPIWKESKTPCVVIDEWMKLLDHKGVGNKIMKIRAKYYKRI